jgi:hypothetical protein
MRLPTIALLVLLALPGELANEDARPPFTVSPARVQAREPLPVDRRDTRSCPGYVIDHNKPLACGGADSPENMQWQTIDDAKEKDKWERKGCRAGQGP